MHYAEFLEMKKWLLVNKIKYLSKIPWAFHPKYAVLSMKLELSDLPDFEECYKNVEEFYKSPPWEWFLNKILTTCPKDIKYKQVKVYIVKDPFFSNAFIIISFCIIILCFIRYNYRNLAKLRLQIRW